MRHQSPATLGELWRLTDDEQAAFDLSQHTFVRAWRHRARRRTYDKSRAGLLRVATGIG